MVALTYRRHLQLLLYLATYPKTKTEDLRRGPSPLTLLYRYLNLFGSDLLRLLPQIHRGPTDHDDLRTPDWLAWKPNGDLERSVRSRALRCTRHGVWSFLRQPAEKKVTKKKRKKRADDDSDDEDEARVLSEDGWGVLEWLVDLWMTSPDALLLQLHAPVGKLLQYDDAGVVLSIVRAAFLPTAPPTPLSVLSDRHATASKLLSLVIDLARPPKAQFHAQSLVLSLVALFRVPATQIPALSRAIRDWNARAHILAVVLEDAAGVRKEREAARRSTAASRANSRAASVDFPRTRMTAPRSRSTTLAVDKALGVSLSTPFQAPDVNYALDLLELDGDDRSPVLAAELIALLIANEAADDAWTRLDDDFIRPHVGVLGRVLIMARRKADLASGRTTKIGVKVEFDKADPDAMDFDETQDTVPLTASQLASLKVDEASDEESQRPPQQPLSGSALTELSDDDMEDKDRDGGHPTAETLPLTNAQRAEFDDMESDEEESQLPAETLPLIRAQRERLAEDDEEDDDGVEGKEGMDEKESQLPAETQLLTAAQRAQFAQDDEGDEESQLPTKMSQARLISSPGAKDSNQSREESVSDILGEELSAGSEDMGNESQLPETMPMTRSQRAQFQDEDEEESQLP